MGIAIATDGGWKRPVIGPGLEAFQAGDAKGAAVPVAAGGPRDEALPTSVGNTARIALEDPADRPGGSPVASPLPAGGIGQKDLLELVAALTGVLAALTELVAGLVERRALASPTAA